MTTADTTRNSEHRSFFAIYKPGQGKYVRWGTVASAGLIIGLGMYWLSHFIPGVWQGAPIGVVSGVVVAFFLIGALLTFMAVNRPRSAEFMIMTESEMRKVTWPSRQTVVNSTKVVIFLTLLLATILWVIDFGFVELFKWIGILGGDLAIGGWPTWAKYTLLGLGVAILLGIASLMFRKSSSRK